MAASPGAAPERAVKIVMTRPLPSSRTSAAPGGMNVSVWPATVVVFPSMVTVADVVASGISTAHSSEVSGTVNPVGVTRSV